MSLDKIISSLETLDGPDRKVDQSLALQVGYTLSIDQGLLSGERDRKVWWFGSPPKEVSLPAFTKSVDAALHLAKLVDPDHTGDITFEGNTWHARLNDGPLVKGPSAAIAMCIAAMKELQRLRITS